MSVDCRQSSARKPLPSPGDAVRRPVPITVPRALIANPGGALFCPVLSSSLTGSPPTLALSGMMVRTQRTYYVAFGIALLIQSCGTANDQEEPHRGADDTRYEIVIVDSAGVQEPGQSDAESAAVRPPPSEMPAAESIDASQPPPPPGVDDEAGGDRLLSFDPDGQYVVQVGVLADLGKARKRVRQLVDLGYPAFLAGRPSTEQTRIRIGFFGSHDDATQFGQRFVRDHGGEFWVDRRPSKGAE